MIHFFDPASLADYMADDWVLREMDSLPASPGYESFMVQGWMRSMPEKRCTFSKVYSDVLKEREGLRILDVGAGISVFTPEFIAKHAFQMVDPLCPQDRAAIEDLSPKLPREVFFQKDWVDFPDDRKFDLIVANDLFPNADQRLREFVEWSLPRCKALRLVLTYFVTPRSYTCMRVDYEEYITVSAWRPEWVRWTLADFAERIEGFAPEKIPEASSEIFKNGRSVVFVEIRGDL
jgi:hypothetical protein